MNPDSRPPNPILIVDDEESILLAMDTILRMAGYNNIVTCQDSRQAMGLIAQHHAEVVLMDLTMPHVSGQALLGQIATEYPDIPVIIITVADDTDTAVQCIKLGAFDFLVKPVDPDRLITSIAKVGHFSELQRENIALRSHMLAEDFEHLEGFSDIITQHRKMFSIFNYIDAIATTSKAVLVTGETGVGKELVSKTLHLKSGRPGQFITVNVAGLDDNVFSDTLFGHVKGAFTGAETARKGLIEEAANGTLLLDEIGNLSISSQVKLLRLLQESEYRPLGMDKPRQTDVRIIAATNENLETLQQAGRFRKDLLFRLQIHHIHIPPLRERPEDIPLLTDHFLQAAAKSLDKKQVTYPKELITLLQTYSFPGNVRELKAIIFDAVSRHQRGVLSLSAFEEYISKRRNGNTAPRSASPPNTLIFPETLPTIDQTVQALLLEAMKRARGNQSVAARLLGVSQQAVNKRLQKMKKADKTNESNFKI